MRSLLCFIIFSTCFQTITAQDKPVKNSLSLGLGGAGMTLSVNYGRIIRTSGNHKLEAKIGTGYFPLYVNDKATFGTLNKLLGLGYLYSVGNHHFESTLINCFSETFDESVANDKFSKVSYTLSPSVGYRYQNFTKRSIFLQAGYSPLLSFGGIGAGRQKVYFKNYVFLGFGFGF